MGTYKVQKGTSTTAASRVLQDTPSSEGETEDSKSRQGNSGSQIRLSKCAKEKCQDERQHDIHI